jgi:glycolate oxidase
VLTATEPQRNWQPIIQTLETIVGSNGIISSREERSVYECDGLASYRELPGLVVLPKTTQEVVDIVKQAQDCRGVPCLRKTVC